MYQGFENDLARVAAIVIALVVWIPLVNGPNVQPVLAKERNTWLGAVLLALFPSIIVATFSLVGLKTVGASTSGEMFALHSFLYAGGCGLFYRSKLLKINSAAAVWSIGFWLGLVDYFVTTRCHVPTLAFLHGH